MSKLEALLPTFEPEVLSRLVSTKAYAAGTELFENRRVSDLVFDGGTLRGRVKGSKPVPHTTTLKLKPSLGETKLVGHCTCPTYSDGWEKICHHAVALALTMRHQYQQGDDITMTQNPWVAGLSDVGRGRRYQIQLRRGRWQVHTFQGGASPTKGGRRRRSLGETMSPADHQIERYIEQAVDETDDEVPILDDAALAGLLYFGRYSSVSLKGTGKLSFESEPLVLRVQAEPRATDAGVDLHAFLEQPGTERVFEVDQGRLIIGSPTWFLVPESGQLFTIPDTPPWVLEAIAKQPRIVMDSRVGPEQMDSLSDSLQTVGVPQGDLFALASDSREVSQIVANIEGDATRIKVRLAARYDNVAIEIKGSDPDTPRFTAALDDQTISFYRDLEAEGAARKLLKNQGVRWSDMDEAFIAQYDAAIEFMIVGIPLLPEAWEKRIPNLPKIRSKSPKPRLSISGGRGSVLDIEASVRVDGEDGLISFRDLLRWLHDGRRWVTLADGSVAKLDPQILQPIAEAAGAIDFDKQGHAELTTLELGTLARLLNAVPTAQVAKEVKKLMSNMTGKRSSRGPRKAKALQAKLRPYQRSGFAWLWQLHTNGMTGILADDMGLGKTVQALALLAKAKEDEGPMPSLIVCPTSVLSVWRQEVRKWAPSLSVLMWHGADRSENRRRLKKSDIIVTSYALLRRDIDELAKIKLRYAALDEAQYIKNWTTNTAKAAKLLKAQHRLALTGTPVENHLVDLWAIFDFLAPGFLGKISEFQKTYVRPIEDGDRKQLEALRARVRPFIMRRRKEDVAKELPPKTEQTLFCRFNKTQLGLYNRILKAAKDEIMGKIDTVGIEKSQMTILAALTRLRQVCCHPKLLGLPTTTTLPPSAKLEMFRELIADIIGGGHKVLVFSQFVEMQKLIGAVLEDLKIDYLWLHGGTKNREDLVNTFQSPSGPPVFLISLRAGGSGLTLTAADTVIHYDPWWNPAVEDQATDRAHRIGQDKSVNVYRLVCEDTVEQKMVELGARKREIAESALGRDTTTGKKLTMEDIENLLSAPGVGFEVG